MDDDWGGQMFMASSKHNCVERCARRFGNLRWVEARSTRVRAIALGRRGFLHGVMMVHGKRFCAAFPLLRSLNPAHFEPHGLQSPCPDVGPREGSRQEEESETRPPKADQRMKVPQRGSDAKRNAPQTNSPRTPAPP